MENYGNFICSQKILDVFTHWEVLEPEYLKNKEIEIKFRLAK